MRDDRGPSSTFAGRSTGRWLCAGLVVVVASLLTAPAWAACYRGGYVAPDGRERPALAEVDGPGEVRVEYLEGGPPIRREATFKSCARNASRLSCSEGARTFIGEPSPEMCRFAATTEVLVVTKDRQPIAGATVEYDGSRSVVTGHDGKATIVTADNHRIERITHREHVTKQLDRPDVGWLGHQGAFSYVLARKGGSAEPDLPPAVSDEEKRRRARQGQVEINADRRVAVEVVSRAPNVSGAECTVPCSVALDPGRYEVHVKEPGFTAPVQRFGMWPGARLKVELALEERFGALQVTGSPAEAVANLTRAADGARFQLRPDGVLRRLRAGDYTVSVQAPGFLPQTQTFTVKEVQRATIDFRLPYDVPADPTPESLGLAVQPLVLPAPPHLLADSYETTDTGGYVVIATGVVAGLVGIPLLVVGIADEDAAPGVVGGLLTASAGLMITLPSFTFTTTYIDESAAAENRRRQREHALEQERYERARQHNERVRQQVASAKVQRQVLIDRNQSEGRHPGLVIEVE